MESVQRDMQEVDRDYKQLQASTGNTGSLIDMIEFNEEEEPIESCSPLPDEYVV